MYTAALGQLAIIGLVLSIYSLFVSYTAGKFKPLCDIKEYISCTKALTSPESKTFVVHNSWYGLAFYMFVVFFPTHVLTLILATLSIIASAYLAHTLYKMKNFCLVCAATYLVNIGIFLLSFINFLQTF